MKNTLRSDCNTCCKYITCRNEAYDIDKSEERALETKETNRPFILYNIESRSIFRKWWISNSNIPEDVEVFDCYQSKKMMRNKEKER